MTGPANLLACEYCDQLQREIALPAGSAAYCCRCSALLFRSPADRADRTLALALAACVMLAVANAFPIMTLEIQGQHSASTLLGAVDILWNQERPIVAGLVFMTTVLFPAIELAAMIYLLLPLRRDLVAPGSAALLRFLQAVKPWGMVEVFMLGVLVSLVKLSNLARVEIGPALWSFGALMLLLAAMAVSFDSREIWRRMRVAP